jgi:arylsulfatase A-like enzyme
MVAFGLAAATLPVQEKTAHAQGSRRPNILIILTDDQRADAASRKVMPATRRLFLKNGTRFRNAVATTPLCCPSRASILSGKYAHNHGVTSNSDGEDFDPDKSIEATLQDEGYKTAYSGKYMNAPLVDPPYFDHWSIMRGGKEYFGVDMNVNGDMRVIDQYISTFIEKKALDFLSRFESKDSDPWFMVVAPYAPHSPAIPERKYRGSPVPAWDANPATKEDSRRELRDKPSYVPKMKVPESRLKDLRKRQLRSLKSVDDMIAKIFRKLRRNNENKRTLAIYLSDNGFMWAEHGLATKRYPYDMSVGIPLYARWPGHVKKGRTPGKIVGNVDVAPTVYEAAGAQPTYPVDGRPLFGPVHRDRILIESFNDPMVPEVPPWKGLWTPGRVYVEYANGEEEFYGAKDKWQLRNRLGNKKTGDDPNNRHQLSVLLKAYGDCKGPTCP